MTIPDKPVFSTPLCEKITDGGIAAVLVIDQLADAVPLAQALLKGGVGVMELTLRTPTALDAIAQIREHVPQMLVGAGTVLTVQQVADVARAGAAFAVAPGTNPRVVEAAIGQGLSFAPGVATPSDVERALELGCRLLKFFPAGPLGGIAYLRNMAAPFTHLGVRFIPLGGVNAANMSDYLQDPLVAAIGGSWIAKRDAIRDHAWDAITRQASEAVEIANRTRSEQSQ